MKRQKHWKSEDEILKAITKAYRQITKLKRMAQCSLDMEELAVRPSEQSRHRDDADVLLKKIWRLENTRLPKLGRLLAEFRTIPLGEAAGVAGLNETQAVLQRKEAVR